MRPSAGEAYSDFIASGPAQRVGNRIRMGHRQGGHRACRSWARRHELPSCPDDVSGDEARTYAPVRSPDRDGDIDDDDLDNQGGNERTHARSAGLRTAVPGRAATTDETLDAAASNGLSGLPNPPRKTL
jgi:hypothetical protein